MSCEDVITKKVVLSGSSCFLPFYCGVEVSRYISFDKDLFKDDDTPVSKWK